jgi:hypothetical protein
MVGLLIPRFCAAICGKERVRRGIVETNSEKSDGSEIYSANETFRDTSCKRPRHGVGFSQ